MKTVADWIESLGLLLVLLFLGFLLSLGVTLLLYPHEAPPPKPAPLGSSENPIYFREAER